MVTNIILFLIFMIILVTVIALIVNHFEQLSKERDTLEAERKEMDNQNFILQNDITELCYSMRTMEELCNLLFEMLRRSYDIQRIGEDVTTVLNIKYKVDSALEQRLEQCIDPENIQWIEDMYGKIEAIAKEEADDIAEQNYREYNPNIDE